jgi:hypothetical protein
VATALDLFHNRLRFALPVYVVDDNVSPGMAKADGHTAAYAGGRACHKRLLAF